MIYRGEGLATWRQGMLRGSAATLFCFTLIACSGSSSGNRDAVDPDDAGGSTPQPTLSLSASPTSVESGGSSTLSWSSSNADSCDASGGWSGARALSGSQQVGPIDQQTTFRLSCSGEGGGVSREVTVNVDSGDGPTVTLSAEPEQIAEGGASTLTWSSDDADSCEASSGSGDWDGDRPTSGTFNTGPLSQTTSYSLTCSGSSGNALASVQVEVLDKTLSWVKPNQNEDGTPLDDLAGFNVYWGTQSRSYSSSETINDPDTTQWEADSVPPGTYFFALTAFDDEGNESNYSNEVTKTIP